MNKISCSLLLLLLLTFGTFKAFAANTLLSGLSPEAVSEVETRFAFLKTDSWTLADLEQVLKFLVVEKQYDNAWIELQAGNYTIHTAKLSRIKSIEVQGHRQFPTDELKDKINLRVQGAFNQSLLEDDLERLRELYRLSGFPKVQVNAEISRPNPLDVVLKIKIKEGPQTLARNIDLIVESRDAIFDDLRRKLRSHRGETISESLSAEIVVAIREHLSKNGYYKAVINGPEVQLSEDQLQADLTFTLKNTERYQVEINGYKNVTRGQIDQYIDLKKYFSQNPNLESELASKVKKFYISRGYSRAQVESQQVPDRGFRRLILKINEGPRSRIQKIEFQGQLNQDSEFYKKRLIENSSSLFQEGFFHREDLDQALKNFVVTRQNEGYLGAKVLSTRTTFDESKANLTIVINYSEGPQTLVQQITFEGNASVAASELTSLTSLKPGGLLRLDVLEDYLKRIETLYQEKGYLEVKILSNSSDLIIYNNDNTEAIINVKLKEGPKIQVGSVVVEGNSMTQDRVILRELEFKIGDILTPALIKESEARLQKLRYFSSIEITTVEKGTPLTERTVTVKVAEREPGVFITGFGANNERQLTLRGYAGTSYGNLFGTGRDISLRTDANYNIAEIQYLEYKLNFNYTEPALFGSRFRGKFDAIRSNRLEETNLDNILDERQYIFSTEMDFSSQWSLNYDLLNTLYSIQQSRPTAAIQTPGKERVIAGTGPTLVFDSRDHQFNPTKGFLSSLNFEVANPDLGSSQTINYFRSVFSANHYWSPFRRPIVFASSFRFGHLRNWSSASTSANATVGVPYSLKGFVLGGLSTIRGFTISESFPGTQELKTNDFYLTTQAQMLLIKSEIRIPIWGNLGTALFYDGGAVYIDGLSFPDPYRDSVGVAFRYSTPVGAVSLEWGYKLDRRTDRNESQLPFQFSIGTF